MSFFLASARGQARVSLRDSSPIGELSAPGTFSGAHFPQQVYFTPRTRPCGAPELFVRPFPAALFLMTAFARRRGLRPACAEALGLARASPAGGWFGAPGFVS